MQKTYPMLWFDNQAEEAAEFYVSIFPNSKAGKVAKYGPGAPLPEGTVLTVEFELDGQKMVALNGGPEFKFNESVSFVVPCESQAEVDKMWDRLVVGGEPSACGWLKDRYGLSWQVVPTELLKLLDDPDPAKSKRAFEAMMKVWGKFNVADLRAAAEAA